MKNFIGFGIGFATSFATFSVATTTSRRPFPELKVKRQFLTCFETYGRGSITCGAEDSHFCYNPDLGESCCLMDNGYCQLGDFCAPVAGFCCHNDEDPATCAVRLDFALPPSYTASADLSLVTESSFPSDSFLTEEAAATTLAAAATSTVEILVADPTSTASETPASAIIVGAFGVQIATTSTSHGMFPDSAAVVNMTAPSATLRAGLVQFTGAADRTEFGTVGLLGVAVVAGLLL